MFSKFKKGDRVIVSGQGKNDGEIYKNKQGIVEERDPYYMDYFIKFKDGTSDWLSERYLRKPYKKKKK